MANFNYNQLNLVARDKESIVFIKNALVKELGNFKEKAAPTSEAFKNIVNIANEVWSGTDKDIFIKNMTASANEYVETAETVKQNIIKYLDQDLANFEALQKDTTRIASTK